MGTQELIIVFLIIFLLFGATRLPQLGSSLGSAIRNFKKGFSGDEEKSAGGEQPKNLAQGDGSSVSSQDKSTTKQG
ncbi:MAG: twin-arginine translocase TatA/TatE family subunit [Myxococcota bacterium]